MLKAFLSKTRELLFEFDGLKLKREFIPIVKLAKEKLKRSKIFLSFDGEEALLSEYIEETRRIDVLVLNTEERKIELPFIVKKGSIKSEDEEGIIEIKPSIEDSDIQISCKNVRAKYEDFFNIEIEIKKNSDVEFYIDFYATDDEDNNRGELSNIYCGRVKVFFNYTVTTDWYTIPAVIPEEKFIRWGYPDVKKNCFDYALKQLEVVGYELKSKSWIKGNGIRKSMNDHIYQLFLEEDVAGMKKGVQREQFEKGVQYLKEALKKAIPVIVGVDDDTTKLNYDLTTEHFVTVVGMGEDEKGKFFLFYDNATKNVKIGTSKDNKLYCDGRYYIIEGSGDKRNGYIQNTSKGRYIVSQIRETKLLKR